MLLGNLLSGPGRVTEVGLILLDCLGRTDDRLDCRHRLVREAKREESGLRLSVGHPIQSSLKVADDVTEVVHLALRIKHSDVERTELFCVLQSLRLKVTHDDSELRTSVSALDTLVREGRQDSDTFLNILPDNLQRGPSLIGQSLGELLNRRVSQSIGLHEDV